MTAATFPYDPVASTPGDLFAGRPLPEVRESRDAAAWWLRRIGGEPDAHHPHLAGVLAEVVAEADALLARRRVPATPTGVRTDLDLIRSRVDLVGYLARRAPVDFRRQPGGELRSRCPFPDHDDRSPSFDVNPDKQVWHCRGCGRGGDLFAFVMQWDGVDFREAVGRLRWDAGIVDPAPPRPDRRREGVIRVG